MAAKRRGRAAALVLFLFFGVLAVGIYAWWRMQRAPSGPRPLALHEVAFADLDSWGSSDPAPALAAFRRSCERLLAMPPSQPLSGTGYGGTAGDWHDVCEALPSAPIAPDAARRWFEASFTPFAVEQGSSREGLFTGYYEPLLDGSRTPHGAFRTPVYGYPNDLIEVDLGDFREKLRGEKIAGRLDGHRLVPYASRSQIDRYGLGNAPVLFFANDPAALFFLQIQGSGRVRFEDGSVFRVAYAGQNGWPYTSIGRALIEEGQIARENMSMQAIRSWMDSHPKDAQAVMEKDRSYVFFKEAPLGNPSLGSPGAFDVPLTPHASIAVDAEIHPLGAPFFVVAGEPDREAAQPEKPLHQLFVAQDTGGAIKGPVRADLFFGYGRDAESMAGRMKSKGQLYVLLPAHLARRVGGLNS